MLSKNKCDISWNNCWLLTSLCAVPSWPGPPGALPLSFSVLCAQRCWGYEQFWWINYFEWAACIEIRTVPNPFITVHFCSTRWKMPLFSCTPSSCRTALHCEPLLQCGQNAQCCAELHIQVSLAVCVLQCRQLQHGQLTVQVLGWAHLFWALHLFRLPAL